jgi:hypothetical protein
LNISIFYIKRVGGCGYYERGKRGAKMFLDILWTTKEGKDSSIMETTYVLRTYDSLKHQQECY